jgi:hypothetical protein
MYDVRTHLLTYNLEKFTFQHGMTYLDVPTTPVIIPDQAYMINRSASIRVLQRAL